MKGAEIAYETILTSFAKGDRAKLKTLLTPDMADNFEQAIISREKDKIKSDFTFIGIKESNLEKYEKIKNELFASVKFVSEVISIKKDKDDKIIEGDPNKIKQVTDYWKFSKNILKKDLIGIYPKLLVSDKKNISSTDAKIWEEYIKNPTDISIKDIDLEKEHTTKSRFKYDLHGFTLEEANKKVEEIILSCSKKL